MPAGETSAIRGNTEKRGQGQADRQFRGGPSHGQVQARRDLECNGRLTGGCSNKRVPVGYASGTRCGSLHARGVWRAAQVSSAFA